MFEPSHEHMRHAIHMTEVLEAAVQTATDMQSCRAEMYKSLANRLGQAYEQQVKEYAAFQISALKNLKLRSDSNQTRLSHEINFVRQPPLTLDICGAIYKYGILRVEWHLLTKLERQAFNNLAMRDSNFIKSITLLTMIFLPATFISVSHFVGRLIIIR